LHFNSLNIQKPVLFTMDSSDTSYIYLSIDLKKQQNGNNHK